MSMSLSLLSGVIYLYLSLFCCFNLIQSVFLLSSDSCQGQFKASRPFLLGSPADRYTSIHHNSWIPAFQQCRRCDTKATFVIASSSLLPASFASPLLSDFWMLITRLYLIPMQKKPLSTPLLASVKPREHMKSPSNQAIIDQGFSRAPSPILLRACTCYECIRTPFSCYSSEGLVFCMTLHILPLSKQPPPW